MSLSSTHAAQAIPLIFLHLNNLNEKRFQESDES
jgi:hypothetical protein